MTPIFNYAFDGEFNDLNVVCVEPMPRDSEEYYGFTEFAIELNELDPQTKHLLPPTDTRFRLDQR